MRRLRMFRPLRSVADVHLVRVPRGPRGTPGDRNLVDVARGRVAERYAGVEREFADLPLQRLLFQVRIHSDHRGPMLAAELRERVGVQTGRQDLE